MLDAYGADKWNVAGNGDLGRQAAQEHHKKTKEGRPLTHTAHTAHTHTQRACVFPVLEVRGVTVKSR